MKSNHRSAAILLTFFTMFISGCTMSADDSELIDDNATLDSSEERGDELGSDPEDEAIGEAVQALGGYSVGSVPARVPRTHGPAPAITVPWSAPAGHAPGDWIGRYKVGAANTSHNGYAYTSSSATTGSVTLTLSDVVGFYEFRYFLSNGYNVAAVSNTLEVHTPYICRSIRTEEPHYYRDWVSCCDNADSTQSFWVHRTYEVFTGWFPRSCFDYGLDP